MVASKIRNRSFQLFFLALFVLLPLGQLQSLSPLTRESNLYFHDLIISALVVFFLITKVWLRQQGWFLNRSILLVSVTMLVSLVINYYRYSPLQLATTFAYQLRFFLYASLYYVVVVVIREKIVSEKFLGVGLFLTGLTISILGLMQYFLYPDLRNLYYLGWDPHKYRLFSTLLDPNFTGIILLLSLILGFSTLTKIPTSFSQGVILGLVIQLVALMLTYSRSSFLALIISFFIFFRSRPSFAILLLLISALAFLPREKSEGTNLVRSSTAISRLNNLQEGLNVFWQNPLIGVGFNGYQYFRLENRDKAITHSAAGADNSYVFILATMGIIGLASFVYLGRNILQLVNQNKTQWRQVGAASYLALLVHANFVNSLFYPWVLIWIWILLGIIEANEKKRLLVQ